MGALRKVFFLVELAFEAVMNPNTSRFQEVESGFRRSFLEEEVVQGYVGQWESAQEYGDRSLVVGLG